MSEGYQVNYCWILKLLSGPRIFKLLNFFGGQLSKNISSLLMSLFLLFLGKRHIPTGEYGMISGRNCLLGHRKKITQFLMRTFTCRSTFLYVCVECRTFSVMFFFHFRTPTICCKSLRYLTSFCCVFVKEPKRFLDSRWFFMKRTLKVVFILYS